MQNNFLWFEKALKYLYVFLSQVALLLINNRLLSIKLCCVEINPVRKVEWAGIHRVMLCSQCILSRRHKMTICPITSDINSYQLVTIVPAEELISPGT